MQVQEPAEVAALSLDDIEEAVPISADEARFGVALKDDWVTALEEKTNCKFDRFYNCYVQGRSSPKHLIEDASAVTFTTGHALCFLAGHSARSVLLTLTAYAKFKLLHGESSACFILPRRTAEWNARVVHMRQIAIVPVKQIEQSALDLDIMAAYTEPQAKQQSHINFQHALLSVAKTRDWELRHDSASANAQLLTSRWHASIAGIPGSLLLDTGAQENFISTDFIEKHGLRFTELSKAGTIKLGNGACAAILGKVTFTLSIRQYHTKTCMYVTDLSPGIDVVLGEPFFRSTSAHIEYCPDGMSAIKVWKGTRRMTLEPLVAKSQPQDGPLLSAIQCKKAMKKARRFFLVNVMHVMSEEGKEADPAAAEAAATTDATAELAEGPVPIDLNDPAKRRKLVSEARLKHLLGKYKQVFKDLPNGLPPDRGVQHTIELLENKTPFKHPYRLSPLELAEAKKQIAELLAKGFIQPSQSPFGAPILFVQKKDGSLRMCIDYRALNALTVRNRYPLPNISDLLDKFAGAQVFSSLDLASGYHQIRISEEDVPKTAFTTPFGHYEFKVLSFGLTNAPATFQAVMNRMFGHLHEFCVVYLDDILIFSKTPEEHEKHLETVLQILEREGLYAKLKKCDFNKPELLYLGHIIGRVASK